jgi:hypothetical protein
MAADFIVEVVLVWTHAGISHRYMSPV